jgi:hypothetical protein
MKKFAKKLCVMLLCASAFTVASCNRNKAGKGTTNLSPEQSKVVDAYRKSVEEAKKIVVARVNGIGITMNDLIGEMNSIGPQYARPGQKKDPALDKKIRTEALDRLIDRELAVQEARRQGMTAPSQEVAAQMQKIRAGFKTEEDFRVSLAKAGITEEELKENIERNILVDMITEKEIFDKVKVDPALVKKTYEKDKASFAGPTGKKLSFEEARPLIEQKLMTPLVQKREDVWVDSLKKSAKIEITLGESAKEIRDVQ